MPPCLNVHSLTNIQVHVTGDYFVNLDMNFMQSYFCPHFPRHLFPYIQRSSINIDPASQTTVCGYKSPWQTGIMLTYMY